MLDGGGDDLALALKPGHAFEHRVVGLGGAAGENDLLGTARKKCRHLAPGRGHRLFGLKAQGIVAAGVAEFPFQKGAHGLEYFRDDGGGGVVVEVDHGIYNFHFCYKMVGILEATRYNSNTL